MAHNDDNGGSAQPSHTGPGGSKPKNTRAAENAAARGAVSYAEAAVIFVGGIVYLFIVSLWPTLYRVLHDGRPVFWCWRVLANSATLWAGLRLISFIHYFFRYGAPRAACTHCAKPSWAPCGRIRVFTSARAKPSPRSTAAQRPMGIGVVDGITIAVAVTGHRQSAISRRRRCERRQRRARHDHRRRRPQARAHACIGAADRQCPP